MISSHRSCSLERTVVFVTAATLLLFPACATSKVNWRGPSAAPVLGCACDAESFSIAEQLYADAARKIASDDPACVDLLFEVAKLTAGDECAAGPTCRCAQVHRSALSLLVVQGQRFGRLDPAVGLTVQSGGSDVLIPIRHLGFVWSPADFHGLIPVGNYDAKEIALRYRCPGVGIPLVVTSCNTNCQAFLPKQSFFAATLCLNLTNSSIDGVASANTSLPATLDLYDPLRQDFTLSKDRSRRIAKDYTAPIAYRLKDETSTILQNFFDPTSMEGDSQLLLVEPYQPGKIPVVFVHGLLSNPYTWVDMVNRLQTCRWYVDHFQTYVFEYPTGRSFLGSAAKLREQLRLSQETFDPGGSDPRLCESVLVGHSMGGLISKVLISSSGNELWAAASNRPYEQVVVPTILQQPIVDSFFFEPSPQVSRAVFIATPHEGAGLANRLVGRITASFVSPEEEFTQAHAELIRCNPGVFTREIRKRVPTSIDLLDPDSPILRTVKGLPVNCRVKKNVIAGDSHWSLGYGRTDGVVPLSSALSIEAESCLVIDANHEKVHKELLAITEVERILQMHLQTIAEACSSKKNPVTETQSPLQIDFAPTSNDGSAAMLDWR